MASYGYGRQVGLASPPPSDGLMPPSSPIDEHSSLSRAHRRERRNATLTPRKFKRFFTPRSQRTPKNRRILEDSRDSALNARPTPPKSSQDAPDLDSPILHSRILSLDPNSKVESRKRKRTGSSESLSGNHELRPLGVDIPANKRRDLSSIAGASDAMQVDFAESCSAEPSSPELSSVSTRRAEPSHSEVQAPLHELITTNDDGPRRNGGLSNLSRGRLSSRTSLSSHALRLNIHDGTIPHADDGPTEDGKQKGAFFSAAANATPFRAPDQDASRPKPAALTDYFKTRRGGFTRESDVKSSKPITLPRSTMETTMLVPGYHPKGVIKLRNRGFDAQRLLREQGLTPRPGRQHLRYPEHDPYIATSKFFSRKTDYLPCNSHLESNGGTTIPFSLASAHTMPWTAIGDEEGFIRCFNTQPSHASVETVEDKVKWAVQYHNNAIMDLAFSSDDLRLATACGDRNGKVIDFMTQKVAVELNDGHDQSMRRVKFQPGRASGDVIATSDKDGRIQIWDLRCSSSPGLSFTVNDTYRGSFSQAANLRLRDTNLPPVPARRFNTFNDAHMRLAVNDAKPASVTALEYMTSGREHLLLSGCEGDARIKLWDTRYVTPRNQAVATPLSVTDAPATHKWRPYGITSMALNTEANRLYAVCKDNTVYCYSTNHLMLGEAPELTAKPLRQRPGEAKRGLGPLYGFRHEQLEVKSFYVRCAVRSNLVACPGPELLAVGSSTGCPILFPTDEASMREAWDRKSQLTHRPPQRQPNHHQQPRQRRDDDDNDSNRNDAVPSLQSNPSDGGFPIVRNGTSLVNGHIRESTGVSWTPNGSLVTISDDNSMRHWQETPTEGGGDPGYEEVARDARDLRTCGNGGSKRFGCGWAYTGEEPYPNAPIVSGWDRDDDPDIFRVGAGADDDGGDDPDFDEE